MSVWIEKDEYEEISTSWRTAEERQRSYFTPGRDKRRWRDSWRSAAKV
jgi:hypothetical protein